MRQVLSEYSKMPLGRRDANVPARTHSSQPAAGAGLLCSAVNPEAWWAKDSAGAAPFYEYLLLRWVALCAPLSALSACMLQGPFEHPQP